MYILKWDNSVKKLPDNWDVHYRMAPHTLHSGKDLEYSYAINVAHCNTYVCQYSDTTLHTVMTFECSFSHRTALPHY